MRRLIEKFYTLSRIKRTLLVMFGIFMISLTVTAYSFYNMAGAVKELMEDGGKNLKYMTTEQIKNRIKGPFLPDHVLTAIDAFEYLSLQAEKIESKENKTHEFVFNFSELSEKQEAELVDNIKAFNRLQWEELKLFAVGQVDPFIDSEPETVNFAKVRRVSRLMTAFLNHYKTKSPKKNATFIFSSIIKLARMIEDMSPYLIGKMIALSVDGIAVYPFRRCYGAAKDLLPKASVFDDSLITADEAAEMKRELLTSLKLEAPFERSLENEYVFFRHFSAKIYEKAPLAAYLLVKIFGNPDLEYRQIINNPGDKELLMKKLMGWKHPLLLIAVPNFTRAFEIYNERLALKATLAAELAFVAGEEPKVRDPFGEGFIKSIAIDGKTRFYSVGPDGKDDKMKNDDISLFLPDKL